MVLEGSFNWYNASVFSHDIVVVAANKEVAEPYLFEFDQILRRPCAYSDEFTHRGKLDVPAPQVDCPRRASLVSVREIYFRAVNGISGFEGSAGSRSSGGHFRKRPESPVE